MTEMKFLKFILPHLAIAMLLGLIVLLILDSRNPLMEFLTGDAAKIYMIIMCVLCITVIGKSICEKNR